MAKLITLMEQHSDRQLPTLVIQATTWWETPLAHVKLQECGLGGHLPVNVCYDYLYACAKCLGLYISIREIHFCTCTFAQKKQTVTH